MLVIPFFTAELLERKIEGLNISIYGIETLSCSLSQTALKTLEIRKHKVQLFSILYSLEFGGLKEIEKPFFYNAAINRVNKLFRLGCSCKSIFE